MESAQLRTTLDYARGIAAALRGDEAAVAGLLTGAQECRDARVPDEFSGVGLVVWQKLRSGAVPAIRPDLQYILDRHVGVERANREALEAIGQVVDANGGHEGTPPALIGDDSVLLGLYGTLAAFRAVEWVVLVRPAANGTHRQVSAALELPFTLRLGPSQRLEVPLRRWSTNMTAAGRTWRVPIGELFAVLLAARVGDPAALPSPPHWFHLAVALMAWRDSLNVHTVLTLADRLDIGARAQRGLAMVGSLFPELKPSLDLSSFEIPLWERLLAVPVAARRVVRESMTEISREQEE
jgi:hypothetical protein